MGHLINDDVYPDVREPSTAATSVAASRQAFRSTICGITGTCPQLKKKIYRKFEIVFLLLMKFAIFQIGRLLVIIMFLVCSGGGWWYRYWLQGRYRAAASAIPSRGTGSSRGQSSLRGPTCPAQQASITYNSARNTVLLHRMWKAGQCRNTYFIIRENFHLSIYPCWFEKSFVVTRWFGLGRSNKCSVG